MQTIYRWLLGVFWCCNICVGHAQTQPAQSSSIAFKQASFVAKEQTVSGLLSLYWLDTNLHVALQADMASQQVLWQNMPNTQAIAYAKSDLKFIELHYSGTDVQLQHLLQQRFDLAHATDFWQRQRGVLHIPAQVRVADFELYDGACDQYFYQARLLDVTPAAHQRSQAIYQESCANGIELERARIVSPDGHANLRAQASTTSAITQRLPKGMWVTVLLKQGAWWQVQVDSEAGDIGPVGYVNHSQLQLWDGE